MRLALHQIYVNLYVEYGEIYTRFPFHNLFCFVFVLFYHGFALMQSTTVVKNPLSPVEHPGGVGVNNELFEESLEQFVVGSNSR